MFPVFVILITDNYSKDSVDKYKLQIIDVKRLNSAL